MFMSNISHTQSLGISSLRCEGLPQQRRFKPSVNIYELMKITSYR